jgi:hypothetical protein
VALPMLKLCHRLLVLHCNDLAACLLVDRLRVLQVTGESHQQQALALQLSAAIDRYMALTIVLAALCVLCGVKAGPSPTPIPDVKRLVVFGDSLSDTGEMGAASAGA